MKRHLGFQIMVLARVYKEGVKLLGVSYDRTRGPIIAEMIIPIKVDLDYFQDIDESVENCFIPLDIWMPAMQYTSGKWMIGLMNDCPGIDVFDIFNYPEIKSGHKTIMGRLGATNRFTTQLLPFDIAGHIVLTRNRAMLMGHTTLLEPLDKVKFQIIDEPVSPCVDTIEKNEEKNGFFVLFEEREGCYLPILAIDDNDESPAYLIELPQLDNVFEELAAQLK